MVDTPQSQVHVCTACIKATGGCCSDIEISMHQKEAHDFVRQHEAGKLPPGHTFKPNKDDPVILEYHSNEEACMFLDAVDKSCTIYDRRPTICRTYPVQWTKKKKRMQYFLDLRCPLAHRIPLNDYETWIQNLPNPHFIELIGELDFKTKSDQYINLTVIQEQAEPPEISRDMTLRTE